MTNFSRTLVAAVLAIYSGALQHPAFAAASPNNGLTPAQANAIMCQAQAQPNPAPAVALLRKLPAFKNAVCDQSTESTPATPKPASDKNASAKGATKSNPPAGNASANTPKGPISLLLRNDWTDTGLLGAACLGASDDGSGNGTGSASSGGNSTTQPPVVIAPAAAKGATASFTQDYAGTNRIWAAQAMAAVAYTECNGHIFPGPGGGGTSGVWEKSLAIYAQVNSDYNSNAALAKKNNVDTRTLGLSGEVAYSDGPIVDVLRLTPNIVFDNINNTTAGAAKLQYIPFGYGLWSGHFIPDTSLLLYFNPTIDLQYAAAMEKSKPLLFSGKDQSLRIGPELAFIVASATYVETNPLTHIGINENFHPWYEAYNGHRSYWWANSIFYNFNKDGTLAATLSYNRGLDENSGTMTNQYMVSLSGKI